MNKAAALAHRYGLAWGIPIHVVEEPFASKHAALSKGLDHFYRWDRNVVFVTCVDRNAARQEVARVCKDYPAWWVDTGNLKTSGQVTVGRELLANEPPPLRLPSVTTWTPSPSLQFPNILQNVKERSATRGLHKFVLRRTRPCRRAGHQYQQQHRISRCFLAGQDVGDEGSPLPLCVCESGCRHAVHVQLTAYPQKTLEGCKGNRKPPRR